jgi:hypothetical protein
MRQLDVERMLAGSCGAAEVEGHHGRHQTGHPRAYF